MFFTKRFNNFGSGCRIVSQHLFADFFFKRLNDVRGKSMRIGWKSNIQHKAGDFPVAGGRILVGGAFGHFTVTADNFLRLAAHGDNFANAQSAKVGNVQPAGLLVDVQQGMGSVIIKPPGIRQMADTDTVHDDQNDTVNHRSKNPPDVISR